MWGLKSNGMNDKYMCIVRVKVLENIFILGYENFCGTNLKKKFAKLLWDEGSIKFTNHICYIGERRLTQ